jgi:hypothetical protein
MLYNTSSGMLFKLDLFRNTNGTIDPTKFVLKAPLFGFAPAVFAAFISEMVGPDVTCGEDQSKAYNYVRGKNYHIWTLQTAQLPLFNEAIVKYENTDGLKAHLKELKAQLSPVPAVGAKPDQEEEEDEGSSDEGSGEDSDE